MRKLTLDEKISIKGVLSRYGVPYYHLNNLDMQSAVWFFGRCVAGSIAFYYLYA